MYWKVELVQCQSFFCLFFIFVTPGKEILKANVRTKNITVPLFIENLVHLPVHRNVIILFLILCESDLFLVWKCRIPCWVLEPLLCKFTYKAYSFLLQTKDVFL